MDYSIEAEQRWSDGQLDRYLREQDQASFLADEEERMMAGESDYHVNGEAATLIPETFVTGENDCPDCGQGLDSKHCWSYGGIVPGDY